MPSQTTEHLRATIAANIDAAIVESGMTNREVGEAMGASETQVWKWRKGKTGIGQTNLVKLAEALGVEWSSFYMAVAA
jgi:transcriptional regulator with XRE-family HTH domain